MTKEEKELINQQFATLRAEIRGENEVIMLVLGQIKEQTQKTNGRVQVLEQQTTICRWLERDSRRILMIVIIFIFINITVTWENIIKLWQGLFS